jgi:hypothetical protein
MASDSMGHLVALPVQVGDVLRAEVMAGDACMLPDGGSVFASGGPDGRFGHVVVFPETSVHGSLRFADVGGCAWLVDATGARNVVDH